MVYPVKAPAFTGEIPDQALSGFRWDETAGLTEQDKLSAAHSRCKRRPAMKKS